MLIILYSKVMYIFCIILCTIEIYHKRSQSWSQKYHTEEFSSVVYPGTGNNKDENKYFCVYEWIEFSRISTAIKALQFVNATKRWIRYRIVRNTQVPYLHFTRKVNQYPLNKAQAGRSSKSLTISLHQHLIILYT